MNVIILIIDAISYKYSWLNSEKHFPKLYNLSKNFLNFHNHFGVSNGTRNNLATILSGLPPSLHKTMNRKNSFRNNKYFNLQQILGRKDYHTMYYGTQPLFHSEKEGDNLDFTESVYLSPSMADFYIPGENFNKFIINKNEKIKNKKHFSIYHYTDVHAPFEPPKLKYKNTKKIKTFLLKNIHHLIKRYLWLQYEKFFSKKLKNTLKKYPHLKKNSFLQGQIISLERYPLNNKFYEKVWNTKELYEDYFEMHKNASIYQDESVSKILEYFKNNSENTIFLMCADHGNSDLISPSLKQKNGILQRELLHVPLSIFSFDEKLNNKFKLKGNVKELTCHADIFNTLINCTLQEELNEKVPNSFFFQNLLKIKKIDRYIFSEFNDLRSGKGRSGFGEIKMFNLKEEVKFNISPSDDIKDIIDYNDVLNNINYQDFEKYFKYKSLLNKNILELKNYINKLNFSKNECN